MSMSLQSLLESYAFLESALRDDARVLSGTLRRDAEKKRDAVFLEIARFESDDTRVTRVQVEFMISTLAELAGSKATAKVLRDACLIHVGRILQRVERTDEIL
jgi:hypothetical protein